MRHYALLNSLITNKNIKPLIMATKYLITLTPHEKFFFGGERTFGDTNAHYLVVSRYFPQQTALLGLLRHQLLVQSNDPQIFADNKIQDPQLAKKLIGEKSFTINGKFDFGKIKSLSPVFITRNSDDTKEYYFPANREYVWKEKFDDECNKEQGWLTVNPVKEETEKGRQLNGKPLIKLENYNPKYDMPDLLINRSGIKYSYDDVFIEHKQVGIRKDYNGKTDEKAFYVQTFWKMKKGYGFSFIAELDFDLKSNHNVVFGGEQQMFRMDVEKFDKGFEDLLPPYESSKNFHKVVLLSDTCVEKDIFPDFDFAITRTGDFRFLVTDLNIKNPARKPDKSQKFEVYKKGSVFYFSDKNKDIPSLFNYDNLRKVGYNHYKIIYAQSN